MGCTDCRSVFCIAVGNGLVKRERENLLFGVREDAKCPSFSELRPAGWEGGLLDRTCAAVALCFASGV